jgi:hypothetical protein
VAQVLNKLAQVFVLCPQSLDLLVLPVDDARYPERNPRLARLVLTVQLLLLGQFREGRIVGHPTLLCNELETLVVFLLELLHPSLCG